MRRVLSYTILILFACATFLEWGTTTAQPSGEQAEVKKELVDVKADIVYPHKLGRDSSVLCLVGNFAAQHNGAVITADSAVRYGDERIDCFGNVLINKNTTYAYADRAVYNGAINEVILYSPIIKVVDEDITLYTYNFKFNTLDNIGEYWGGGVTSNKDSSRMESLRGYYYADIKDVVGVDSVEVFTPDYEVKGDSVRYNMESEYAEFFENTNIWTSSDEYLYTERGDYDKAQSRFSFTRDGYMLNSQQEAWSDSLDYYRDTEELIMRSNIQIDDTVNKVLVYSDFAHYWGDDERVFLTMRPSLVNYDPERGDTLFMRSDTIIITSHNRAAELRDSLALLPPRRADGEGAPQPPGGGDGNRPGMPPTPPSTDSDSSAPEGDEGKEKPVLVDSTAIRLRESLSIDTLSKEQRKEITTKLKNIRRDSISLVRSQQRVEKLKAQKIRDERLAAKMQAHRDAREAKIQARLLKRGKVVDCDSCGHHHHGEDSLHAHALDSLPAAPPAVERDISQDSVVLFSKDSIYRIIVGFRDARTLQGNQQSASDSMSFNMRDTTMHLYINPYMWSDVNQVSSEVMDIYTSRGAVDSAVFIGNPIMASMIDTTYYNQVSGRLITSHFINNELTRNEVDGNVRTIYYMQDDDTFEVTTMTYVESGTSTFFFEEGELDGITYRAEPVYTFYPVGLIPVTQTMRLDGFVWQGRERPTRRDFIDRYRRPSVREEKEALPPPQYPIHNAMELERLSLIYDRRWMDRNDLVPSHAEEWLESLGYRSGQPRESNSL